MAFRDRLLSSADVAHAAGARSASALGLAGDAWLGVATWANGGE